MDDLVFGPALSGITSSQPSILAQRNRRLAVRESIVPAKEASKDKELILPIHGDQLMLIRIEDRAQPEWCEICGRESGLYWTGSLVTCIDCAQDKKLLRSMGYTLMKRERKPWEFYLWLARQKNLMKELFS